MCWGTKGDREGDALVEEALRIAEQTDYINHTADALLALAEEHRVRGKNEPARAAAARALALYEQKESLVMAQRTSLFLEGLAPRGNNGIS